MKKFSEKFIRFIHILVPLLLAICITLLAVLIQPNSFKMMAGTFISQPLLFLLNVLPVFLLLVCFGSLFRNIYYGGALVNVLICGMSIANRIKVNTRDEPLMPRDFLLLREVREAVSSYDIDFPVFLMLLVLLTTVALILLGVLYGKKYGKKGKWGLRILVSALSVAALFGLTVTVFASDDLYYSFPCTNSYYIARTYNEYGMPYSFFHNMTANPIDCPEGYDSERAMEWDGREVNTDGPQVHLIMIMSEAFTDLTDSEVFDYSEENDPLRFFHLLRQDPHCITGRVVVPNFGGGTSNTEFDVMTGMQTDSISSVTTTAFDVVNRNLDSLFRVYNAAGYSTEYIHPGYTWFYNRQNVLPRMGAQRTLFYEEMEDKAMKGTWVTDDYVADLLIEAFETAVDRGDMLYNYTTTIQNHMAYTTDKYGEGYTYPAIETNLELSQDALAVLGVYIEGLRDADRMLEKLVSYFEGTDEPVVLAFWGDHYPNLGNGLSYYQELGMIDDIDFPFENYATPYIIWTNEAGAEALGWEEAVDSLELPENGYLSSCYLGAALLELCGRGEATPWYSFLNELRRELPVVWNNECYLDGDGNLRYDLTEEQRELISRWRCWSYYKMTEKDIAD